MKIEKHVLSALPATAAWRHLGFRDGFEIAHFDTAGSDGTIRITGHSLAVEGDTSYSVQYTVSVDEDWKTLEAQIETRTRDAAWTTQLACDVHGSWSVDGRTRPDLAGCRDIDLEASVVTNTIPIHRLAAFPGTHEVRAVYVRASEPLVEVLEQTYAIPPHTTSQFFCAYTAPQFDYSANLQYDEAGLIVEYPNLATRSRGRQ